jgi:Predicted membrane protein (DUF2142)
VRRERTGRGRSLWLLAFLAFFLIGAAWATAEPYNATPDEAQHIYRAVGVAYGGLAPADGSTETVPRSLIASYCWVGNATLSAHCGREPGGDSTPAPHPSDAGRYNPVYYLVVGWPLRLWPNWTGVYLARLISVGLIACCLAWALYGTIRWSRYRLLAAAVLVATTPMTMHLAGGINPNGLEIAAGTALFAALVPLALDPDSPYRRPLMVQALAAATVLAVLRAFGPLWLLVAFVALFVPTSRAALRAATRGRPVRVGLGVVAVAVTFGIAWTEFAKTGATTSSNLPIKISLDHALRIEVLQRAGSYAQEMVGVMSWTDTFMPGWFYLAWYAALGALVVTALFLGGWVERWRLAVLTGAAFGIPIMLDTLEANTYGLVSQGRYTLPIAVGIPILAAFILGRRGVFDEAQTGRLIRGFAVLLLPLHLFALGYTMIRWQSGFPNWPHMMSINPLRGNWHPRVGSAVPLLLGIAGAAALLAACWQAARPVVPSNAIAHGRDRVPEAAGTDADPRAEASSEGEPYPGSPVRHGPLDVLRGR